jgi:epoxide hydrolase-like predicted phosphatase
LIKGLILDAGGVLIRAEARDARRNWEADRGHPSGFLDEALAAAIGPGWAGGRSEEAIDTELVRRTGIAEHELSALHAVLGSHEKVDPDLARDLRRMRSSCRVAVLSNAGPRRRADLVDRLHVDELVDVIVISAEEGLAKPDPRIYRLTAARLGVDPFDCLFVDDHAVNVEAAIATGMTGVVYDGYPTFAAAVRRHLGGPRTEVNDAVSA